MRATRRETLADFVYKPKLAALRLDAAAVPTRCPRSAILPGVPVDAELLDAIRRARRRLPLRDPIQTRGPGHFDRVAIPSRDADVLRDLLIADRPRVVIEIGLAYASSALAIAEALVSLGTDGARHVIIDAYQDRFEDIGWTALVDAGLGERCSLIRERSQLALPRFVQEGLVADAAFVDGSHVFHNVFVDLAFLGELVRAGGLIILDDVAWPSVATAVAYFEANMDWNRQPIVEESRLRAYRLPEVRAEPSFEAFKPFGVASAL